MLDVIGALELGKAILCGCAGSADCVWRQFGALLIFAALRDCCGFVVCHRGHRRCGRVCHGSRRATSPSRDTVPDLDNRSFGGVVGVAGLP